MLTSLEKPTDPGTPRHRWSLSATDWRASDVEGESGDITYAEKFVGGWTGAAPLDNPVQRVGITR